MAFRKINSTNVKGPLTKAIPRQTPVPVETKQVRIQLEDSFECDVTITKYLTPRTTYVLVFHAAQTITTDFYYDERHEAWYTHGWATSVTATGSVGRRILDPNIYALWPSLMFERICKYLRAVNALY